MRASADTADQRAYGATNVSRPATDRVPDEVGHVIGICADSNAQLPEELASRFGIEVVPMTIVVDDREYLEGVDITADEFYELYADGHRPTVEFTQPSPGQFAAAYDELVARGCTQILSIHTSASVSGTLKAARLAAHCSPVPVRLVDSRSARFGVSCCIWATADAVAAGASLEQAATTAESLASSIGNVFVGDGLDLAGEELSGTRPLRRQSVRTFSRGESTLIREVDNLVDAVNAMAGYTVAWGSRVPSLIPSMSGPSRGRECGDRLHVAVGFAHQALAPVAEALTHAVGECSLVSEVIQFRIGPSLGVETGPGVVGCVMYPTA